MEAVEGRLRLDQVVLRVFELLREVRLGSVVAVWWDGGVSAHRDLGFRHRVLPNGMKDEPVTTFVATSEVPSVAEIRERIRKAMGLAANRSAGG